MAQVGEHLRSKREEQGLTIEKIAEITKINLRYIKALEEGNYQIIGGDVYCKGFLRNYARALGLNPQEIINMYKEETSSEKSKPEQEKPEKIKKLSKYEDKKVEKVAKKPVKWMVYFVVLMLVGISGGILMWQLSHKKSINISKKPAIQKPITKKQEIIKQTTETTQTAQNKENKTQPEKKEKEKPPIQKSENQNSKNVGEKIQQSNSINKVAETQKEQEEKVATAENSTENKKEVKKIHGITLKGNVIAKTWVQVYVDGKKEFEGILNPPKTVEWHAKDNIKIKVGNAGGIEWYLNNEKIGFFGKSGEVITKNFNSKGE